MSYSIDALSDDCHEGTMVLINKLGIKNEEQLAENEALITTYKAAILENQDMDDNFYFENYKAVHKFLFDELYEWAGTLRTIDISKSTTKFYSTDTIQEIGSAIFERLKKQNYFKDLPFDLFVDEIADLYHSINMLHPFREGNGRCQRSFFTMLIRYARYDINFHDINPDVLMIATIQAASGISDNLKEIFRKNIIV